MWAANICRPSGPEVTRVTSYLRRNGFELYNGRISRGAFDFVMNNLAAAK